MPADDYHIEISITGQRLLLKQGESVVREYPVSTAGNGAGERQDSYCTPRGRHSICEKIGAGCRPGTVFVGRRPTGEVYHPGLGAANPERDWILTRILRLEGREPGRNRGGQVDSYSRYIYIHGTPADVAVGRPGSHGCIRMRDDDVMDLFDRVAVGTEVSIRE